MWNECQRLLFFKEIREAVNIFSAIEYSVITGGFAQNNRKRGDVDILTVLPFVDNPEANIGRIKRFAQQHVEIQLKHSFKPDMHFPTDVLSRQQMAEVVSGRALYIEKGKLLLKYYSEAEIIHNAESDYRIWLYEMITHDFNIIAGNFSSLICDTKAALRTVFLYTAALFAYSKKKRLADVRSDMFASAKLPYRLGEKQCRHLIEVIKDNRLGFLSEKGDVIFDDEKLQQAITELGTHVARTPTPFLAHHMYRWEELRNAVSKYKLRI